jgi:hypothetical protein
LIENNGDRAANLRLKEHPMANEDFDFSSLFQGPGAVLSGVLGVADNARKTVGGVMDTIATLQRAAAAVEQLVTRMNNLVDDLEAPLRLLTPELEKAVARVQRVSTALEGPIDRLLPGLESAIGTFDRVALSQLPETVDEARKQLQSLLDIFGEVPRRLGLLGNRSGLGALFPLGLGNGESRKKREEAGIEKVTPFAAPPTPKKKSSTTVIAAKTNPVKKKPSAKKLPAKKSPAKKSGTTKRA